MLGIVKRKRRGLGLIQTPPPALPERLLSVKEMAVVLNCDPRTLRRYVLEGRAPALRMADRSVRFRPSEVLAAVTTPIVVKKSGE